MIVELADRVFSNAKYGTDKTIDRENFAIGEFARKIEVDNRPCGCSRLTACNHPNLEKINILTNGL